MKTIHLKLFSVLMLVVLMIGSATVIATAAPAAVTTTYTADSSTFPNPERGFHNRYDIVPGGSTDFSRSVNSGNTLVHSYVRLDSYRSSDIPQSVLNQLTNSLNAARNQGVKVILRVAYNFGPYPNSAPDATEAWIGTHLSQLKPVLAANADVIAYMEAGFIGAWGEWHTSTNGLDTNMAAKIRILNNMLSNYPASVQVALRYPSDVRSVINGGVSSARIGNHQDCFLASDPDDWGTWARDPLYTVQQDKDYIASVGVNHPVGGETCNASSPRANCSTALNEMAWMHFSELNEDYASGVINAFKSGGCYNTIKQKMGYRFRLTSATYPTSVSSGGSFNLQATIVNDGWASPYNARPLFAVLDGSGGTYTFPLSDDPRNWKSGQTVTINRTFTLPANMPAGTYKLALWLPDNASVLQSRPEYSIRFANQNVWDSTKGYNVLATNISVGGGGATATPVPPTNTPVAATATKTNTPVPGATATKTNTPAGGVTSYEAESGSNTLAGGAVTAACSACSGGNKVGYVGNNAGTLQFNGVSAATAGNYTLTIYYLSGATRSAQLSVNGGSAVTLNFASLGNWTTVGTLTTTVSLNAGSNTIKFSNATGWAPDFDRITVNTNGGPTNTPVPPTATPTPTSTRTNTPVTPVTLTATSTPTATRTNTPVTPGTPTATSYEAESGSNTLAGGAVVATCSACSGGNKVGYVGNNAGTLQFNGVSAATAGNYTLTIYYLSGAARSAQLSVNGGSAVTLNFASTGGWTTVGSHQMTVNLNAGSNTILFTNPVVGSWAPDFDRVTVR